MKEHDDSISTIHNEENSENAETIPASPIESWMKQHCTKVLAGTAIASVIVGGIVYASKPPEALSDYRSMSQTSSDYSSSSSSDYDLEDTSTENIDVAELSADEIAADSPGPDFVYIENHKRYETKDNWRNIILRDYEPKNANMPTESTLSGMLEDAIYDGYLSVDEMSPLIDIAASFGDLGDATEEAITAYIEINGLDFDEALGKSNDVRKSSGDRVDFESAARLSAAQERLAEYHPDSLYSQQTLYNFEVEAMAELEEKVNGMTNEEWTALQPSYERIASDYYGSPRAILTLFEFEIEAYHEMNK